MRSAAVRLTVALAVAAILTIAPAANAGLVSGLVGAALPGCGAVSYPFAQFGDTGAYCTPANNGFENGAAGWTLYGGAAVVADNEPWYAGGPGRGALDLPPGAVAVSPSVPISLLDPYWRFFAAAGAADGPLRVQIVFRGLTGNVTGLLNMGELPASSYAGWRPTGDVVSLLALPLGTSAAQMVVRSAASSGDWRIDDVFVDPWLNRLG